MNPVFTAETHNFPTGIAPFQGATTGTGGRIRDNHATGRGAYLIAGTAGYNVGQLFPTDSDYSWDNENFYTKECLNSPIKILVEGSNGVSDYGNKIGEPVIQGYVRSFGSKLNIPSLLNKIDMNTNTFIHNNKYWEWLKPILFTGGIGQMQDIHKEKEKPQEDMLVVRIGGPAYRIGVGGGSSSSSIQEQNDETDLYKKYSHAIQRGDPEMENKLNRVIKTCCDLGVNNPILSIHDQGAGGLGNVSKEIVDPMGADLYLNSISSGDLSMNSFEKWIAEFQESDVLLTNSENIELLKEICMRENVPCNIFGRIINKNNVTVYTPNNEKLIDFPVKEIVNPTLRKKYNLLNPIKIKDSNISLFDFIKDVNLNTILFNIFKNVSVGSKRFLTNKVDRSVTGLISQQQCIGPLYTPLSNYSCVAQSYYGLTGIASTIGEKPLLAFRNPDAMARMCIGEMLTNMMFIKISALENIKCSGNWMWPNIDDEEKYNLWSAVNSMCNYMKQIGICLDGGKDSLSMATKIKDEIIKSPRTLVLSGYVDVPDITDKITPEFKDDDNSIIFINLGSEKRNKLGGSALYQSLLNENDDAIDLFLNEVPDAPEAEYLIKIFKFIQEYLHLLHVYL